MAKILVTGFTAKQRGEGRPQVLTLLDGVVPALEHLGHQVERRKVALDEDLSSFDLAIVGVYDYRGTSATAQKFQATRACLALPHVLAWDDWNSRGIWGSFSRGPDEFWASGMHKNDPRHQEMKAEFERCWKPAATRQAERWAERVESCVCCAFSWGDHRVLRAEHDFGSLLCWDPTPWLRGYYGTQLDGHVIPKDRQWVLASLGNFDNWLGAVNPTWPVTTQMKPGPGARGWQVTESRVFQTYACNWGVLSPPYDHLRGSGWWRNRYVLAADAGCVLWAHPNEFLPNLGCSYYYTPLDSIEEMSDAGLLGLAEKQAAELDEWQLSKDASASKLWDWLLERTT